MKLPWSSRSLLLPGFTRNHRQLSQSRKLILALGTAGLIVLLYLLYVGFDLLSQRRSTHPPYLVPAWKGASEQRTAGFYTRDWSLYLGWNNVAYYSKVVHCNT